MAELKRMLKNRGDGRVVEESLILTSSSVSA